MNVQSHDAYANARRFERYVRAIAPIVAADPLAHLERVLRGVDAKRESRHRPIPRHRALIIWNNP